MSVQEQEVSQNEPEAQAASADVKENCTVTQDDDDDDDGKAVKAPMKKKRKRRSVPSMNGSGWMYSMSVVSSRPACLQVNSSVRAQSCCMVSGSFSC